LTEGEATLNYSASVSALPDLSIRQLEYLVAVADEPTWAHAAARVGVSPSALSQGLAELERRVGVALFDRDRRRRAIRPTAGPVVAHARHVLALTADLATWAGRVRSGTAGRLRVGLIDAAAVVHFPDSLAAFRTARPDVDLLLRVAPSAPLIEALVAGELDVVVCVEPPAPVGGVLTEPLLEEVLAVYGPPGTTVGGPATWGPWVLFPSGSHTRSIVVDELARLGAPIDIVAESHQPEVVREMVRLGSGWTVLPASQAEHGDRPLASGRRIASRRLVVARRDGAVPDPAADELVVALRRAASR
jgi:DNA-binding transcriptional LysR family regulator